MKRDRKAQSVAGSSRFKVSVESASDVTSVESAESSDVTVSLEPAQKRPRIPHSSTSSSCSGSAEQPAIAVLPAQVVGTAKKRIRKAKPAAGSSRSKSVVQPASSVESTEQSDASVSSEPALKRARNLQTSAASSTSGSAEQPTISVPFAHIAYITCAENSQDFSTNRDQRALLTAINNVLEAGATIVNIALTRGRDLVDTAAIILVLRSAFTDAWTGSDGKPAYTVHKIGLVMSFISCSGATFISEKILDPAGGNPALMLTVSAPEGNVCMIISSMPALPQRALARVLHCFIAAAEETQAKYIVIGGSWQCSRLSIENIVCNEKVPFEFFTNEHLSLLAHVPDCALLKCLKLDTEGPYSLMGVWDNPRSVEQHAPKKARSKRKRSQLPPLRLIPNTPFWDKFLENLELAAPGHRSGGQFIKHLTDCSFQDKLLKMDMFGDPTPTPVPLSVKMEELLVAAHGQRLKHQKKLQRRGYANAFDPLEDMQMHAEDMKEIINSWGYDVESWMKPSTKEAYTDFLEHNEHQAAHQLRRRAFNTYQFQLSGSKFFLHKLIELPLISLPSSGRVRSVEPAVILNQLFAAYEDHKQTPAYQAAIQRNEEHQAVQLRLSKQIWWAQWNYSQGKKLADMVKDGTRSFLELSYQEQQLVQDFHARRSHRKLDEVLEMKALKQKPYRGHATETRSTLLLT